MKKTFTTYLHHMEKSPSVSSLNPKVKCEYKVATKLQILNSLAHCRENYMPNKPGQAVESALDTDAVPEQKQNGGGGGLDDLLGEFEDSDLDFDELPVPGGGPLPPSGGAPVAKNAKVQRVIYDHLTIGTELGFVAFCKVVGATGYYEDTDETVPYVLKEFKIKTLNQTVTNAQASNLADNKTSLGIRRLKDQVIDEIEFWGKLKHDNVVKVFIWYEDYGTGPLD